MKRMQHYIEYGLLQMVCFLLGLMPLKTVQVLAAAFGWFVYYVIPIRKKVAHDNIARSFPEKTKDEVDRIAKAAYVQFAKTVFEMIYMPHLSREDVEKIAVLENRDILDRIQKNGKGCVMVGGHFGNWEIMGSAFANHYPVTFVVGEQTNKMVDEVILKNRIDKGMKIVHQKVALRGVLQALKNNEFVALVSDQDAHETGAFVPFLWREASTPKGPAMFALRGGVPLIVGTCFRTPQDTFRIVVEEVSQPLLSGDADKDIINYTASYTAIIERHIRAHPDHWFWMHRRWKTQKPERERRL